jgi:hypothetical protein
MKWHAMRLVVMTPVRLSVVTLPARSEVVCDTGR